MFVVVIYFTCHMIGVAASVIFLFNISKPWHGTFSEIVHAILSKFLLSHTLTQEYM